MTATVEFIVARAEDALKVSNTALRFSPTEAMMTELARLSEENGRGERPPPGGPGEGAPEEPAKEESGPQRRRGQDQGSEATSRLFYVDEDGNLAVAFVETGLTDGQSTVVESPKVVAGMQIIAAVTSSSSPTAVASNPFQSQNGNRPPGGPQR
jgi:hypothetical protein